VRPDENPADPLIPDALKMFDASEVDRDAFIPFSQYGKAI